MKKYSFEKIPYEFLSLINPYINVFGTLKPQIEFEIFDAKENIISFSKPIDKLRFMIKGRAKITLIHEDGKQSIVHFAKKEEFLGELTFLEIEKEHKNVTAISECIFLSVDMPLAKSSLKSDSEFLFNLSQFIGNKMLDRTYFNSKNQNYELKNRLAAYILLTQDNEIYNEKHTETAEYLSVSYRHLLYTIKEFINEGLLTKLNKGYKINIKLLKNLSKDIDL